MQHTVDGIMKNAVIVVVLANVGIDFCSLAPNHSFLLYYFCSSASIASLSLSRRHTKKRTIRYI